jgi:hypothetical protein
VSLPIQKLAARTTPLPIQKLAARTTPLPIHKSVARTTPLLIHKSSTNYAAADFEIGSQKLCRCRFNNRP